LFIAVVGMIGQTDPNHLATDAAEILTAITLGVVVAILLNWLTAAEHDLGFQPGGSPLFPIRADWLNYSLRLTVSVILTRRLTLWFLLPTSPSVVSVMFLSTALNRDALLLKGEQRLIGAFLGGGAALLAFLVLAHVPHFPILLILVFLGMFAASYYHRAVPPHAYIGLQMGLVFPMVLIVPPTEFGSMTVVFERLIGVFIALGTTLAIDEVWPEVKP
jgi:uncharacterized membrane protein YccC